MHEVRSAFQKFIFNALKGQNYFENQSETIELLQMKTELS